MSHSKLITKYNGKKAIRSKCRYISGQFYEKNVDCFKINGRWNRVDNGLIFYDHSKQKWDVFSNCDYVNGFIDEEVKGYFSLTDEVVQFRNVFFLNEKVALKNGFVPELKSDGVVPRDYPNKKGIFQRYTNFAYTYNLLDFDYSEVKCCPTNKKELLLDKYLNGFKFGFEFETKDGYVPIRDLLKYDVRPLRDGSLRWEDGYEPYEFVTYPKQGYSGYYEIRQFCDILQKRAVNSPKCSVHVHISGLKNDKSTICRAYHVFTLLQQKIYAMFPAYKQKPGLINEEIEPHIKLTNKQYTKKLPVYNSKDKRLFFCDIFHFLSMGQNLSCDTHVNNNIFDDTNKWDISSRYTYVNLIPFLFFDSKTIEFRIHEGNFDKNAISNWLIFCIGILKYIESEDDSVLLKKELSFNTVFKNNPYLNQLREYYERRFNFYNRNPNYDNQQINFEAYEERNQIL